jgi:hypothetical protein
VISSRYFFMLKSEFERSPGKNRRLFININIIKLSNEPNFFLVFFGSMRKNIILIMLYYEASSPLLSREVKKLAENLVV